MTTWLALSWPFGWAYRRGYWSGKRVQAILHSIDREQRMSDDYGRAAAAYLDEAQPKAEPWTTGDARAWLDAAFDREAKALKAALAKIGVTG